MKNLLKIEELFLFGLSLFLFSGLGYGWGWYALFFFAPDLSILGYPANPRIGAWTYNLIHHKGGQRHFMFWALYSPSHG